MYFPITGYNNGISLNRLKHYMSSYTNVGFNYCLDSQESPVTLIDCYHLQFPKSITVYDNILDYYVMLTNNIHFLN
jgi:hypothetical protein